MVTEGGRGEAVDDAAEEVEEVMVVMRVRVKTTWRRALVTESGFRVIRIQQERVCELGFL